MDLPNDLPQTFNRMLRKLRHANAADPGFRIRTAARIWIPETDIVKSTVSLLCAIVLTLPHQRTQLCQGGGMNFLAALH